jgi:hypothetical protein
MKYHVDECLGPKVLAALRACDRDATGPEDFGGLGTLDPDWLPRVADEQRMLLTNDDEIRHQRGETVYFHTHGLMATFYPNPIPIESPVRRMAWLLQSVARIEACHRRLTKGCKLRVGTGGALWIYEPQSRTWKKLRE